MASSAAPPANYCLAAVLAHPGVLAPAVRDARLLLAPGSQATPALLAAAADALLRALGPARTALLRAELHVAARDGTAALNALADSVDTASLSSAAASSGSLAVWVRAHALCGRLPSVLARALNALQPQPEVRDCYVANPCD